MEISDAELKRVFAEVNAIEERAREIKRIGPWNKDVFLRLVKEAEKAAAPIGDKWMIGDTLESVYTLGEPSWIE